LRWGICLTPFAEWVCPVFAPVGCSQFYAAGALRSSDAAYRYRYCDRLFGITDTTAFPV